MFQSKIEETKNGIDEKIETILKTPIQTFYDGTSIFITGGTGKKFDKCEI